MKKFLSLIFVVCLNLHSGLDPRLQNLLKNPQVKALQMKYGPSRGVIILALSLANYDLTVLTEEKCIKAAILLNSGGNDV